MKHILGLLIFGCVVTVAHAEQFTGKVNIVIDGDTVMVKRKGAAPVKVRLVEIDAPEMSQPGGMDSKQSLSSMVLHKQVSVESDTVDSYGRLLAHLKIDGLDVNAEQIRLGMAWEYSNFHRNHELKQLQKEAKQEKRGLWAENDPVPPWVWRKQHTADAAAAHDEKVVKPGSDPACGSK